MRRRWGRAARDRVAVTALSVGIHLALLSWLGLSTTRRGIQTGGAPDLTLQLVPADALAPQAAPARASRSSPGEPGQEAGARAAPSLEPRPSPSARAEVAPPTAPEGAGPTPFEVASPGSAPSASASGGPAGPQGVGAALRGLLGCGGGIVRLTGEERTRCAERIARTAKAAPPGFDPIPPEKRTYYDAVQAAYEASRHPEAPYYLDANGVVRAWGHPPAVGCTFKRAFRPGASLADKIKATGMIAVPIGPLSCGLMLPQGSMTPELGIPDPGVTR